MTIRRRWLGASIAAALWWSACGPADDVSDPPAPPSVDEVPALTNESPITLTGTAEAGALVTVRGGAASPVDALANDDGSFSIEVELHPDAENTLRVSQTVGELESDAVTLTVRHDGTPPAVPALRPVISPTRRPHQRIRGTTEPHAAIRITGGAEEATGTANDAGEFAIVVPLRTTDAGTVDNELRVVATDAAGNA
ncbi:MAG TPA: Ig-like domain-containing protein, partial [Sandaracinaceae bacterium]